MLIPNPNPPPIALPPGRFRRWIKSDMLVLRWVFLALYILIAGGLALKWFEEWHDTIFLVILGAMLASQALLILGTGTVRLCHPIRRPRLILPIIGAATMMTLLGGGLVGAMWELLNVDKLNIPHGDILFFAILGISWIGWGVLLWHHVKDRAKHSVLSRVTACLFAGSLLELLATVPSHIIVSRRPGCFVGLATMMGIVAGLCVMFVSFGPMIFLLFLRPRHRAEIGADGHPHCPGCGYDLFASRERCPECGLPVSS
jgi:hypothetical protein